VVDLDQRDRHVDDLGVRRPLRDVCAKPLRPGPEAAIEVDDPPHRSDDLADRDLAATDR
jgi:hypothetical protein